MNDELRSDWQYVLDELSCLKNIVPHSKTLNNKGRVNACYLDKCIYKTLHQWLTVHSKVCKSQKSKEKAAEYRVKGNGFYLKGDSNQSLYYYTKAVLLAPRTSEELKLAFGNRSAALFNIGKYEECISDISYAIEGDGDNSSNLRDVKLLIRKAKAYEHLNRCIKAKDVYQLASKMILNINYQDKKKLEQLKHEIEAGLNKFKQTTTNFQFSECNKEVEFNLIKKNFISKPEFPSASSTLTLLENETKGRFVIAGEDVRVGEVLFLEKPFAFVILPTYSHERCQTCCKYIINPLPCKHCSEACFCNEECRKTAWNKFHKWECGFGLDLNYMIGIAHLGFRVAITGFTNPTSPDYQIVKNLQEHIQSLESEDLFQYTLTATVLVIYLENFTNILQGPNRIDSLLEIGGLILLHIAQMVCNGHAITDVVLTTQINEEELFNEEQVRVATAIYPSASMMNHSCDPSIINGFKDQYLIVRSIKNIKKGEEVYNCYGPHFRRVNREERRSSLLQQYMFFCECTQCISEEDFIQRFIGYKCCVKTCDGIVPKGETNCAKCLMKITDDCIKTIEKAKADMNSAKCAAKGRNFQKSVEIAEAALKSFSKYLYKHNKYILECKDFLAQMLAALGRYFDSYKLVDENIAGNKELFGTNSIEVAHEIVKLMDIASTIFNHMIGDNKAFKKDETKFKDILQQTVKYGEEALEIFRLNYGQMNNKYVETQEQMKLFQSIFPSK